MPYESFIFAATASEDPWARTAVSAGAVEEVVSTDRRRRSRGPKIRREPRTGQATAPTTETSELIEIPAPAASDENAKS